MEVVGSAWSSFWLSSALLVPCRRSGRQDYVPLALTRQSGVRSPRYSSSWRMRACWPGKRGRLLDQLTAEHLRLQTRHARWPATANPHLLISQSTAGSLNPVSRSYVQATARQAGITIAGLRADRLLAEGHACGSDPLRLTHLFGISEPPPSATAPSTVPSAASGRLSWRSGCDDLAGFVGVAWRYPASPPGGSGDGEVSELVWVPADFDVVPGYVAPGCVDEGGDVAGIGGVQGSLPVDAGAVPLGQPMADCGLAQVAAGPDGDSGLLHGRGGQTAARRCGNSARDGGLLSRSTGRSGLAGPRRAGPPAGVRSGACRPW